MGFRVRTVSKDGEEMIIGTYQSREKAASVMKGLRTSSKKRGHWNTGDVYWIEKTEPRPQSHGSFGSFSRFRVGGLGMLR